MNAIRPSCSFYPPETLDIKDHAVRQKRPAVIRRTLWNARVLLQTRDARARICKHLTCARCYCP
jgi:hypothetical protein